MDTDDLQQWGPYLLDAGSFVTAVNSQIDEGDTEWQLERLADTLIPQRSF